MDIQQNRYNPKDVNQISDKKKIPLKLVITIACAVSVITTAIVLLKEKPDLSTLPNNLEQSINLVCDIYQVARYRAQEERSNDVIVLTDVEFSTFNDLKVLNIINQPTDEQTIVFGNYFKLFPSFKMQADPLLETFVMAPLIGWSALSEKYKRIKLPVILAHPADGYRLGAKPLRIRWLKYKEIQKVLKGDLDELDINKWPWLERKKVKEKLKQLIS